MHYFVDASSGQVLDKWNSHPHDRGDGRCGQTLFLGDVSMVTNSISGGYQLVDPTRGGGNTRDGKGKVIDQVYNTAAIMTDADNNWGNNAESHRATVAVGCALRRRRHVGLLQDDLRPQRHLQRWRGREELRQRHCTAARHWVQRGVVRHAVCTTATAAAPHLPLIVARHRRPRDEPRREPGRQPTSPIPTIPAASTKPTPTSWARWSSSTPTTPTTWRTTRSARRSTLQRRPASALRYMLRPERCDGNASYDCYPAGGLGGVDPHYSSGPANHFFYLLARGHHPAGFSYKTCNSVCNGRHGRGRHRPRRRAAHLVSRADRAT